MNDVGKIFPLRLSNEFHQLLKEAAKKENKALYQFIIDTLQAAIKKGGNENE